MGYFRWLFAFASGLLPVLSSACWADAAQRHGVSVELLYAIAKVESSLQPHAVNSSHQAKTHTLDVGLMGINTDPRVLSKLGLTVQDLYDPCTNIDVGARILAEKIAKYGRTWEAVGAYNASCVQLREPKCGQIRRRYAWRVYGFLSNAMTVPGGRQQSPPLQLVKLQ